MIELDTSAPRAWCTTRKHSCGVWYSDTENTCVTQDKSRNRKGSLLGSANNPTACPPQHARMVVRLAFGSPKTSYIGYRDQKLACKKRIIARTYSEVHENGIGSGALDEENPHALGVLELEAAGNVGDEPGLPLAVLALRDGRIGRGTPGFAPALRPLVEVVPFACAYCKGFVFV